MTEVGPPYLFGSDERDACYSVSCDVATGSVEMVVRGRFSVRRSAEVHTALRKCLAEHPAAIIVDLAEFDDPYAVSAAMWLAVTRAAAARYPPVRLALAVPTGSPLMGRLRRLGGARLLLCPTVARARESAAGTAPPAERLFLGHLPPCASSVAVVGELVDVACDKWHMPELLRPSRAIMSALVDNAVAHAGTDIDATVWRRGPGLHLSVRDGDPRLPRLLPPEPDERAGGLWTVDGTSTAWGAMATGDGKVVWATLRTRRQRPF